MSFSDIFKVAEYKKTIETQKQEIHDLSQRMQHRNETIEELTRKVNTQQAVLTDEHGNAIEIKKLLPELEKKRVELDDIIKEKQKLISRSEQQISQLKNEIVELNETVLLQDFGLYEPTYDFATSSEYKEKLQDIRLKQKQLIKAKMAAFCRNTWTVSGSLRSGQKMINDNIKQTMLAFNTECENAIDRVKFNNFDSMKKRIVKIYEKLNKLNQTLDIIISPRYLDYKIEELTLAHEYALKKQEEKEYAREQREIQRENAKVMKEIEDERRRIEKEQAHYKNQMRRLVEQRDSETNEARKNLISDKIDAVKKELIDLDKALEDVDYRQANQRAGYVYIISNIGSFGEGIYKIGMTRRLEPHDRIDELSGASVPFKFDVHAMIFSDDAPKLETALHNAFANNRVNMINGRKEFFNVSLDEIKEVVRKNYDKTVEFYDVPIAQQYRETQKIKNYEKNNC